ncbi:MAG: methyltransferase domain-containing protein [Candidatus Aenigmarchaeota archaeon]|nr:methyltransferase domain-containing protein [Candidatus Aenigmarchaeota archaeon]
MSDVEEARQKLLKSLTDEGYLKSTGVIGAFERVDRKNFVLEEHCKIAYADCPLPIPGGVTMSAPHMHAIVLELLDLKNNDDVLEIGFGSGILLAYMGEIVKNGKIVGAEIKKETYEFGKANLEKAGYEDLTLLNEDVIKCGARMGKFDKIAVSAAVKTIPDELTRLLKNRGRMIIPVGEYFQNLFVVEKNGNRIEKKSVGGVAFVPLR